MDIIEAPGTPDGVIAWTPAHVLALAPDARAAGAARRIAAPGQWRSLGADAEAVWGLCHGSGAEPYQVVVALAEPAFRCSCPSRQSPCKHGLAVLLLWVAGHVPMAARPAYAAEWVSRRAARAAAAPVREADADAEQPPDDVPAARRPRTTAAPSAAPVRDPARERRVEERADRVARGLRDLDRWMTYCARTGLTAAPLAQYATWDAVAARLVDAQAPALANRVRRLAGLVGTRPGWHEHVLAELGALHLLCEGGRRVFTLPPDLADSVRGALGFTVRQADVFARAPETDRWVVCGRSDTLEDRIVVRRLWLRGQASRRWALLLSFAAYGQDLDSSLAVGTVVHADLHRYPGQGELRCLLGRVHDPSLPLDDESVAAGAAIDIPSTSIAGGCDEIGAALAAVPWTERWPVTVDAAPTLADGRWVLTDHTGSLPLVAGADGLAPLVAVSGGHPLTLTCEWTSAGVLPLAAHLGDRSLDLGPRGGFHERRAWSR